MITHPMPPISAAKLNTWSTFSHTCMHAATSQRCGVHLGLCAKVSRKWDEKLRLPLPPMHANT